MNLLVLIDTASLAHLKSDPGPFLQCLAPELAHKALCDCAPSVFLASSQVFALRTLHSSYTELLLVPQMCFLSLCPFAFICALHFPISELFFEGLILVLLDVFLTCPHSMI